MQQKCSKMYQSDHPEINLGKKAKGRKGKREKKETRGKMCEGKCKEHVVCKWWTGCTG